MIKYKELSKEELKSLSAELNALYESEKAKGLSLDMSRGKPGADQLDLSMNLLDTVTSSDELKSENGFDIRNYGILDGIDEAKKIMGDMMEFPASQIYVGGNSSLNLMHDFISFAFVHTLPGGEKPWGKQDVKFLCPSPGYDRHFSISEHFGFELIAVPMTASGPDMDVVERLVAEDASVKGIWCVPKYSNPIGITFSDDTVRRLASLKTKAKDFRIMWDNAYAVHHLYTDKQDKLLNIFDEAKKAGNENIVLSFCSTSKITFPGAGISAIGASDDNLNFFKKHMAFQTIGFDKVNQLRHVKYLKDINGVNAVMQKHMSILAPKFEATLSILKQELAGLDIAWWEEPRGGYFISFDVMEGCAKRVVDLCKQAGVILTPAGATFPYGKDPKDQNIRIAPSFPPTEQLVMASKLLCLCTKIAATEKLLQS